jgi:hypothetical protein
MFKPEQETELLVLSLLQKEGYTLLGNTLQCPMVGYKLQLSLEFVWHMKLMTYLEIFYIRVPQLLMKFSNVDM